MPTLKEQYENFAKEVNGISYADWLAWQEKMLTDSLYETRTEKLIRLREHKWEEAVVWREREKELQEAIEELKVETKKPLIYESPDKGKTIYAREIGSDPGSKKRIK